MPTANRLLQKCLILPLLRSGKVDVCGSAQQFSSSQPSLVSSRLHASCTRSCNLISTFQRARKGAYQFSTTWEIWHRHLHGEVYGDVWQLLSRWAASAASPSGTKAWGALSTQCLGEGREGRFERLLASLVLDLLCAYACAFPLYWHCKPKHTP